MLLARLVLYSTAFQVAFNMARVLVPLYALATGHSAFAVGVLMAVLSLGPALLAIHAGRWVDRAGARTPLAVAITLAALCLAIPPLFPVERYGLAPLVVSCVLGGPGFTLFVLIFQQLVGYLSTPANRTGNFAVLSLAYSASSMGAPLAGGMLIDRFGHASAYLVGLAFCLLAAALLVADRAVLPKAWPAAGKARGGGRVFELLGFSAVRRILVVNALVSVAWDLQNFIVPVYGYGIGLSATEIGWILGLFALGSLAVRMAMPFLHRILSEWQVIACAFFVDAAAYAAFPFFTAMSALMAVMFLLGCGLGATQPNVLSLLHTETPAGRIGEAIGIRTMLLNVSHTGLPLLLGVVGTALGPLPIFLAMAGALAAGGLWCRRFTKQGSVRASDPDGSASKEVSPREAEKGQKAGFRRQKNL